MGARHVVRPFTGFQGAKDARGHLFDAPRMVGFPASAR